MRLALPSVMTAIPLATLVVRTSAFIGTSSVAAVSFSNVTFKLTVMLPLRAREFRLCCPGLPQPVAHQMHAIGTFIHQDGNRRVRARVRNMLRHFLHDERVADKQADDSRCVLTRFFLHNCTLIKFHE